MNIKIGHGYDIHRTAEDRKMIIGGVEIPYEKGLLGHSDADVLIHAIIDSILGALGKGDIGTHFPDTSDDYLNIDSAILLKRTMDILKKEGYTVGNLDSTVIAQRPKLNPHISAIRARLAEIMNIPQESINVKAKTEEGLGYIGSGDAISAHAVVIIERIQG
jgi:2-C-methyl-D-erythritol 2,4-cyclodiphosphate synthase